MELLSAGQAYSSLLAATQGTNLAGEETRTIFTAVAGAMSALGKSAADTEGALQAVQQMVSKGTVQAEELRGQLGERLPGAFRIAAESLGLTTAQLSKLLEKGGLAADDLLPRLADRLNELYGSDRRSTLVTEMNRLNNAVTELYTTIADVGALGLAIAGLSSLRDIVKEISVYTGLIGSGRISDALALDADSVARMRLRLGQGTSLTDAQSAEWDSAFGMSGGTPTKVTVKPKPAFQPSGGTSKETLDAYERMTRMIQERTQALQYETSVQATLNPLVNDYGFAMEKARAEADLLNAAERAKIEITPEVRQNIDALATAYAEATVEAERLREQQEYLVGQLADLNDLGKDVLGGFITDMQNGVSAADALSNALAKVGDKLLGMALDSLFNPVGSGPGGLLGSLLGSFGGSKAVGGPVNAGQIYRVGERGPEMFVPDVAGHHAASIAAIGNGTLMAVAPGRGILAHRNANGSVSGYVALNQAEDWIGSIDFTDVRSGLAVVAEQFTGWAPHLVALVRDSVAEPTPRPIYALPADLRWSRRAGMTLLGDAAHLMSPFAGEGANLAMLDGAELGRWIAANRDCSNAALAAYEEALFARSNPIARLSARNLEVFFGAGAPASVVNLFKPLRGKADNR